MVGKIVKYYLFNRKTYFDWNYIPVWNFDNWEFFSKFFFKIFIGSEKRAEKSSKTGGNFNTFAETLINASIVRSKSK